MTKLRECPFCGGVEVGPYHGTCGGNTVACDCGAQGPIVDGIAEAFAEWNRRASDVYAPTEAGLKALGGDS
jgi:Lar family restriction alleviation protein